MNQLLMLKSNDLIGASEYTKVHDLNSGWKKLEIYQKIGNQVQSRSKSNTRHFIIRKLNHLYSLQFIGYKSDYSEVDAFQTILVFFLVINFDMQ